MGLLVSQMINPQKVLGFLDVFGNWDSRLALVMAGALLVAGILQFFILRQSTPLIEPEFQISKINRIDVDLIIGSVLFGIGWGLSGFCPAPAISALSLGVSENYVFCAAMFAGMGLFRILHR